MNTVPTPVRPLPRITLRNISGLLVAEPPRPSGTPAFDPFVLPKVPHTLLAFATALGHLHFQRSQCCLAVLLLLETQDGRWTLRLPRQTCTPAGSCWSVLADLDGMAPTELLAGTFQVRLGLNEISDAVPITDGVHFVLQPRQPCGLGAFVRLGEHIQAVPLASVSFSDSEMLLTASWPQLTLV